MGLGLWFRDDVIRILGASLIGMSNALDANRALNEEYAAAYEHGFQDAIRAVAVGFGVVAPSVPPQPNQRGDAYALSLRDWREHW